MTVTKVKNTLKDKEVQVKEGPKGGVTRLVTTLKPGASTRICSDPNATSREYSMTLPDNTTLPTLISSDDFAHHKEIHIVEEDGKVDWKGTVPRRPERQRGLFRRILDRFFAPCLMLMANQVANQVFDE